MLSERAFFSFVDLAPDTDHRAYNEWHQLDHLPENLSLPGVAWGDRWARSSECQAAAGAYASPEYAGVDYVAMYWFHPPYEESVAAWTKLGEDSFQWGRGPRMPGVRRTLTAFFTPVKGYVAQRALVSADALPLRPNRGLHITVNWFRDHHGPGAHEHHRWEDRVEIPELLDVDGVAGAWTFSFRAAQRHSTLAMNDPQEYGAGELRIRLLYLDGDPVEIAQALNDRRMRSNTENGTVSDPSGAECLLSAPLRTIVPWQDW